MKNFSFTLYGMKWKVLFVLPRTLKKHDNDGKPPFGLCDVDKRIIYIDKTVDIERQRATLYHELTHAFLSVSVGIKQERGDRFEEELVCNLVAAGLCELFNTGLLRELHVP